MMKAILKKSTLALAVIASLGLSACNEDKSTTNDSTVINKSSTGVITGFGSIFINGVEYETDQASFVVDGVAGDESLLKLGMVVTLSGDAAADGTGNAVAVEFENEVEGIVIDNSNYGTDGTFNIMGLTIHTDEDTVFESAVDSVTSMAEIANDNIIEVSGYSSGDGSVWATRLEVKKPLLSDGDDIEMKGRVSLPITDTTFMIGEMVVNYASAEFDDMTVDMIAEGLLLEVKSDTELNDAKELVATKIELKNSGKKKHKYEEDDEEVEVQGVITNVISSTEIEVNGSTVLLETTTRIVHGDVSTLTNGLKVKVKGNVDVDGNLVAEKLIFKPSGDIKMTGKIEATDIINNTIKLFGLTVTLNNSTMVEDDRDDVDKSELVKYKFGVDDLVVGDWIKIKAFKNASGGLTATKAKRKTFKEGKEEKLEGKIESVDMLALTTVVAGVTVDYSSAGEFTPEVGMKAELKGSFTDNVFTASEGDAETDDSVYIGGSDQHEDDEDHEEPEHDDNDKDEDDISDSDDKNDNI